MDGRGRRRDRARGARIVKTRVAVALLALAAGCQKTPEPMALPPIVVQSPIRLPITVVEGASARWYLAANSPPRYGEPVPIQMTAYCLTRTQTRRGRYVRAGIVAADPKLFPLARYIELYVGRRYLGRFLIDDTGRLIKGNIIDIWMPTCREARLFGRRNGTAVLVPREPTVTLAGQARGQGSENRGQASKAP
jgi:3D (Asp-Asp-Asp) domain-containing protein